MPKKGGKKGVEQRVKGNVKVRLEGACLVSVMFGHVSISKYPVYIGNWPIMQLYNMNS